jgi:uncharacterized membrane protein
MSVEEGKGIAVVAYLSWIGWIIALVINSQNKKNDFVSFHVRQALGILIGYIATFIGGFILMFLLAFAIPFLGIFVGYFIILGGVAFWFIMWLLGFIYALQGNYQTIPMFGDSFQRWFKSL